MGQNTYRYMDESAGVPGSPVGSQLLAPRSLKVGGFASALYTITVDTNTDGADYVILLTGVTGNQVSITAVGGSTATLTASAIATAIRSNSDTAGAWSLTTAAGVVTIAAKSTGTSYTITSSDAKLTIAEVTAGASGGANVGFGLAVEVAADGTCHTADGTGTFKGISVRQNSGLQAFDDAGYAPGTLATVLQIGRLEVQLDSGVTSVTEGGNVYYRTAGTGTLGAWRTSADGGNTTQLESAMWEGSAKQINGSSSYSAILLFSVV